MATTGTMTIEELEQLPEDEGRFELLDGDLIEMAPTGFDHGKLSTRMLTLINVFVLERELGTVVGTDAGFILRRDPNRVLAPDIAFVSAEQFAIDAEQPGFLELAPDFVVEIVSPSDRWNYVNDKVNAYLDAGVRLIWVVDPRRKEVIVHTPDRVARTVAGDTTLDGGDVLPGFEITLGKLFG